MFDPHLKIVRHPLIALVIERDPSFAFCRYIGTCHFRRLLNRDWGYCTWCNQRVPPKRATWCSQACIDAAGIHTSDDLAARVAYQRDGKCVFCGSSENLEVDHVLPVILGGGLCGPENLRTLCHDHHADMSRELDRYRTKERQLRGAVNA